MQARRFHKFLFLIIFAVSGRAYGQTGTSSPYSRYGIGDLQTFSHARNAGMGGLSFALREDSTIPDFINFNNPASYTSFKLTSFDAGIMGSYGRLQNSKNDETVTNASVQYFGFGFPVTKWWGGCFGLKPYSSVGYGMSDSSSVSDTISGTSIPVNNVFNGKGGLNQFYIGSAVQPFKNSVTRFRASEKYKNLKEIAAKEPIDPAVELYAAERKEFGIAKTAFENSRQKYIATKDSLRDARPNFVSAREKFEAAKDKFKQAEKTYYATRQENTSTLIEKMETRRRALSGISIGVNSSFLFGTLDRERRIEYRNSAYYDFKQINSSDLGGFYFNLGLQYSYTFRNNTSLVVGAVFTPSTAIKGSQTILAERFQFIDTQDGGYDNIKDTVKYEKANDGSVTLPMAFGGGIAFKKAGKWQIGFDYLQQNWSGYEAFGQNDGLSDSRRGAIGFEAAPGREKKILGRGKTFYRIGAYYSQTYLQLKSTQLNDYGVSLGFGFPIARRSGMINLAFELGERGTTSNNLIKEQYLNLRIGFTFNDKWFLKRKYD